MVLRHSLQQVRGRSIVALRKSLIEKGRPMDEQLLRIELRNEGAIEPDEIAVLIAQHNGYVQFTCHRGAKDDCDYVDPPVVTVHEDGTWERV
jgi:hypothetical protein